MNQSRFRSLILVSLVTLLVGGGFAFVAPKQARADALGDFISRMTLGDFIRSLFGLPPAGSSATPTPTPAYRTPTRPPKVTSTPTRPPKVTSTPTRPPKVTSTPTRPPKITSTPTPPTGTTPQPTNTPVPPDPTSTTVPGGPTPTEVPTNTPVPVATATPGNNPPAPTDTPAPPPPNSTNTPIPEPTFTPPPLYNSFDSWWTDFLGYVSGTGGTGTSLTVLEDWRNDIPVPTPTRQS